jgi:hypothetical protein
MLTGYSAVVKKKNKLPGHPVTGTDAVPVIGFSFLYSSASRLD